ncbi:type IV pilus assembly protein PilA [Clostridium beijerinckii]|uniref:prepilin-type N-terminal cleavage/methylation domain-containing protein n=1 Tax=Clostridium beijerinckii TaxID=1520 RepID=UPI00156F0691|nr:prepilin-type N-terminal cleavage/methylation domain-containing protein [Clostridium beijerinckii]NRT36945.1 type IV pilus assembly protein PilA [Clostridium beijerinckii]NRT43621.1 type IV pilus assembly protein PilA [Clostridium beijerinckii]NRZ22387.1 type IV pilus assembly protein PilA [Clostridium beijerinckii]
MNQLLLKKSNEISKRKKKGFTLVELIIVIAIIAILAAIAIPKFGEIRNNANRKADVATAKNIKTAIANEIANNTTGYTGNVTSKAVGSDILGKLDGNGAPKVIGKTGFNYAITDGDIIITYSDGTEVSLDATPSTNNTSNTTN